MDETCSLLAYVSQGLSKGSGRWVGVLALGMHFSQGLPKQIVVFGHCFQSGPARSEVKWQRTQLLFSPGSGSPAFHHSGNLSLGSSDARKGVGEWTPRQAPMDAARRVVSDNRRESRFIFIKVTQRRDAKKQKGQL